MELNPGKRSARPEIHGPGLSNPAMRELRECPLQPGRLRISRQSCGLRYLKAREIRDKVPKTAFEMIYKQGLEICLGCPEGRLFATGILSRRLKSGKSD